MRKLLAVAIFAGALFSVIAASGIHHASAQTASGPTVYLTWRTVDGAAPADYAGKILPTANSQVAASLEVITANGKLADLSGQTIYWYLDDNFIGGGAGKQNIAFAAPGNVEIMSLRATIPNYAGTGLVNTVHIRMVNPQIAIIAPYPNKTFTGSSVEITAFPYFFPVSELPNLVYQWNVNGQTVASQENPLDLLINLNGSTPAGYSLSANLGARASDNQFLGAQGSITLTSSSQ